MRNETNSAKKRILVVDDDAAMIGLIVEILKDDRLDVLAVMTGSEALKALQHGHFASVLLDWNLHGNRCAIPNEISGRSVLQKCREVYPLLPVIVLSGDDRTDVRSDAIMAGADSFLAKPFSGEVLKKLVDRWVNRTQLAGTNRFVINGDVELPPLEEVKRRYVLHVLDQAGGNISSAASKLHVHRHTISAYLRAPSTRIRAGKGGQP